MKKLFLSLIGIFFGIGHIISAQEEPGGHSNLTLNYSTGVPVEDYYGASGGQIGIANYSPSGVTDVTTSPILEMTPDLKELARGLDFNALKIFNYVRNEIQSELYFGLKKGPRLTYLESSGNDLDKCYLLAALLKIAANETGSAATINIAYSLQSIPYYSSDANTPDICSLWNLDPNAMTFDPQGAAGNLGQWYKNNTPYIESALGEKDWNDPAWRRISLAFHTAVHQGYANDQRMIIPSSSGSLTIRRFYVQGSGLPGGYSGSVLLDPWAVKYQVTPKANISLPSLPDPNTFIPGEIVDTVFWKPHSDGNAKWHDNLLVPRLNTDATTLLNYLKSGSVLGELSCDEIFGARKLVKVNYSHLQDANVSGVTVEGTAQANVSKFLAWKLRLSVDQGSTVDVFLPSLSGRRLSIHKTKVGSTKKMILGCEKHIFGTDFEVEPLSETTVSSSTFTKQISSSLLLPFSTFENKISQSYQFTYSGDNIWKSEYYALIYSFNNAGGLLRARQSRLDEMLQLASYDYPGSTNGNAIDWPLIDNDVLVRAISLETLNTQGINWIYQTNLVRKSAGNVFEVNLDKSFSFGRIAQVGGYYLDAFQQYSYAVSRYGNYNEAGGAMACSYAAMFLESALEHSIIEQANDKYTIHENKIWRAEGASTSNILSKTPHETVNGSDLCAFGIITRQSNLATPAYYQLERIRITPAEDQINSFFQNASGQPVWSPPPIALTVLYGRGLFRKEPGDNYPSSFQGRAELSPTSIRMLVGDGLGGYSTQGTPMETGYIYENSYSESQYFLWDATSVIDEKSVSIASYNKYSAYGADPVDLSNGSFEHAEVDLKLGSGDAPTGLSFQRSYSSLRSRHDTAGLGRGWTHNWNIRLIESTEAAAALGTTIPRQMTPFVVCLYGMKQTLIPPKKGTDYNGYDIQTINPKRWMMVNGLAKWCMDRITNNAMSVTMGKEGETFIKAPDGGYEASSGSTMTLTVSSLGAAELKQRNGNRIKFNDIYNKDLGYKRGRVSEIVGPNGQSITIAWVGRGVSSVTSTAGSVVRKLAFTYDSTARNQLVRVDEVVGNTINRSVTFGYDQGALISARDPENLSPKQTSLSGGATLYSYQASEYGSVPNCLSYMKDPMGRDVVRNNYDAFLRVTSQDSGIIEMSGGQLLKPWKFRYAGICTTEIDPLGGMKRNYYDYKGRQIMQVDALGYQSTNSYDEEDRVILTTDPRGARIETTYDQWNNVVQTKEFRKADAEVPYITQTEYYPYPDLRPYRQTDALLRQTTYTYPGGSTAADPLTVTQGGKTTTYSYISSGFTKGLAQTVSDESGTLVTYAYDGQGNLSSETKPGGYSVQYQNYTPSGDAQTIIDENGRTDTFLYNNRRQPIEHKRSATTEYKMVETSLYDATGKLALEKTETGRSGGFKSKGYEYLSSGKPTYVRYGGADGKLGTADDTFECKVYDEREWVTQVRDTSGNFSDISYFANGWTKETVLPPDPKLGIRKESSEYDFIGRPSTEKDVLDRVVTNSYSEHVTGSLPDGSPVVSDRVTTTDPMSFSTTSWTDAVGHQRLLADKRGKAYQMDYDSWDRLTKTTTPDGRYFQNSYLADGRVSTLVKGTSGSTVTVQNTYSSGTRRLSSVNWSPGSETVTYDSYDAKGNLLSISEAGKSVTRTYDAFDRVKTYTNADGWTIGYEYYNDGMLKRVYYPSVANDANPFDNDSVYYQYDQQGRLTTITDWRGKVTTYTWRVDGKLKSILRPNGTKRELYYDSLSRIIGFIERGQNNALISIQHLDYRKTEDFASTFTHPRPPTGGSSTPVAIAAATYGNDNQITNLNGLYHETDSRGNLRKALLDGTGTTADLTFDSRDRLTGVDSIKDTTYSYDPEGTRRSMTHDGATTNYVYDPHGGSLIRMLVRITPTGTKRYVYGIGLDYEVDMATNVASHYHYDFTGSTMAITDNAGAVTDRFSYSPYGQLVYSTGNTDTPFKFSGFMGVITDSNGLLSMRARFYSPVLARFISMDPAKFEGGLNWYAYANGSPMTLGDPTGFGSESTLDAIQTGLSVLGMLPGVGFVFDLVNAGISVARGNYGEAALNLLSAIPGIGDAAGAAKVGRGAFKMVEMASDAGKIAGKEALFATRGIPKTGIARFDKLAVESSHFDRAIAGIKSRGFDVRAAPLGASQPAFIKPGNKTFYYDPKYMTYLDLRHEINHLQQFKQADSIRIGGTRGARYEFGSYMMERNLGIKHGFNDGYMSYLENKLSSYGSSYMGK